MEPWDSLLRSLRIGVTLIILHGLWWRFYPASRTQFPGAYHMRDVLRLALGCGVLMSLMDGGFGYLDGTGSVWGATLYGVGTFITVVLGGILFRWLGRRGA